MLLCGPDDERPGIKLADFHLAKGTDRSANAMPASQSGTPLYMAPEQITAAWHDIRPCTDLYALGCIAFELVCGVPAYGGHTVTELFKNHMAGRRVPFAPRCDVPEGLEWWIARLLDPVPTHRFQRAADAAWRLTQVATSASMRPCAPESPQSRAERWQRLTTLSALLAPSEQLPAAHEVAASDAPPMTANWRGPASAPRSLPTTTSLWGLRLLPIVDRSNQRDALWRQLASVVTKRQVGAVGPGAGQAQRGTTARCPSAVAGCTRAQP